MQKIQVVLNQRYSYLRSVQLQLEHAVWQALEVLTDFNFTTACHNCLVGLYLWSQHA